MPDGSGATYVPLAPSRILDTRVGTGLSGPFVSGTARTFQVTGHGGVAASATAVTGNLTVTAQTSAGYVFLAPVATNTPTASTLNFPLADNQTQPLGHGRAGPSSRTGQTTPVLQLVAIYEQAAPARKVRLQVWKDAGAVAAVI